jgi:hypothetical protein
MADFYPANPSSKLGTVNNCAVATTSTAVLSSAFGTQTYQIRIAAAAACYFKVGDVAATPTATVTDAYLPPTWVDYIKVNPGQKISIFSPTIQTVSVVEVTS